jgi:Fur family ferric uptake transcriptional regulator
LREFLNKVMAIESHSSDTWFDLLREGCRRSTAPLRAVISVLSASHKALSPVEIQTAARRDCPSLGLATVYRLLSRMERLGLIHRIHQTNHCNLFLRATVGHEHLLICTSCRKAEYIHESDLTELTSTLSRRSGFVIQGHLLQFQGLCSACQNTGSKKRRLP